MSVHPVDYEVFENIPLDRMSETLNELASTIGAVDDEAGILGFEDLYPLGIHKETIYRKKPVDYFLLGCVQPAEIGGESVVYDAREAAATIRTDHPELLGVKITYINEPSNEVSATLPLVGIDEHCVASLSYRQQYEHDYVQNLPQEWGIDDFYYYIDGVLNDCVVFDEKLKQGDAIIVNNATTLHSRQPFSGFRKMLRLRVFAQS